MLGEHYLALRFVHVATVCLSVGLFVFRAGLRMKDSAWLSSPFLRIAPHVIDTVLLGSAVLLVLALRQYPIANGWLTAKVLGLAVYVMLGSIAIKRGRTPTTRNAALAGALVTVGYIVATALHHDADPRHWW